MLFNSITYAIFLPIVFLLYWAIGYARINDSLKLRLQNAFVVVASYVFYGWWDWRFLILIAFTSLCSYASGLLIDKHYTLNITHKRLPKFWLTANIVLNLGILAIFKYYDFFVTEFITAFFPASVQPSFLHSFTLKIILPVGISFYTFQALSYSIDVYRGNIKPTKDIIAFFAFISFFPQLVAGPIERATNLLPQFERPRTFDYATAVEGLRRILWGLFKKIVVADTCAIYVDRVWADYANQSGSTLLLAAIFFAFQIYGDFSGYSDIAIGTAKLFGITLRENFRMPYFSRNVAEFWRRWHISLNMWFRDYVYIPLGGSRPNVVEGGMLKVDSKKKFIIVRNVFIVFLLCGLWHGANWTYIGWGAYHAVLFIPLIWLGRNRKWKEERIAWYHMPQILLTFVLVVLGWIIFRAPSIADAWGYVWGMVDTSLLATPMMAGVWRALCLVTIMIVVEWIHRNEEHGFAIAKLPRWGRVLAMYMLIFSILFFMGGSQPFIYFQF